MSVAALLPLVYQHYDDRVADARRRDALFAHYTSADNALKILSSRSLWLRNAAVMNDHSEIAHGRAILDGLVEGDVGKRLWAVLDAAHDGISNDILSRYYHQAHYAREVTFMSSLCEHRPDDWLGRLSMWRAYGGSTAGVALVFKAGIVIEPGIDLELFASPVLYGGSAEVEGELRRVVDALEANRNVIAQCDWATVAGVLSSALRFALSTKHPGFEEEREWRLLCTLDDLSPAAPIEQIVASVAGVPQRFCVLRLPDIGAPEARSIGWESLLDRIIIGPSLFPETIKDAFGTELRRQGDGRWDQLIEISDIPFRQ